MEFGGTFTGWTPCAWLEGTVTGICRDPKDKPVLECAGRAEAECIVTGANPAVRIGPSTTLASYTCAQLRAACTVS